MMFEEDDESGSSDGEVDYRHQRHGEGAVVEYIKALPTESRLVHETQNFDTQDRQDHSFNGVFFNVRCGTELPIVYTTLDSLWIRGELGPMKVFITKEPVSFEGVYNNPQEWELLYDKSHEPHNEYDGNSDDGASRYAELKLDVKRVVNPGETYGVYVHSGLESDRGVVYDDSNRSRRVIDNGSLCVQQGAYAHLNCEPFNMTAPWGGHGIRRNREFVGRISFGVRWILWTPEQHNRFPEQYKSIVMTLILCWNRLDTELSWLPQEMVFFILNMIPWGTFGKPEIEEPEEPEVGHYEHERRLRGVNDYQLFHYFLAAHAHNVHSDDDMSDLNDSDDDEDEDADDNNTDADDDDYELQDDDDDANDDGDNDEDGDGDNKVDESQGCKNNHSSDDSNTEVPPCKKQK
eukprot:m.32052 g.32052  ORF g.32052 m.32052 type:complete len:405 (-) comp16571_c0_seq1:258-1472(-)